MQTDILVNGINFNVANCTQLFKTESEFVAFHLSVPEVYHGMDDEKRTKLLECAWSAIELNSGKKVTDPIVTPAANVETTAPAEVKTIGTTDTHETEPQEGHALQGQD